MKPSENLHDHEHQFIHDPINKINIKLFIFYVAHVPIMYIKLKIIRSYKVFELFGNIISRHDHNKTGLLYYKILLKVW